MADLSDICNYLKSTAVAAVYPNGTTQPSVANMDVRLYRGWPLPDQLDLDVSGTILSGTPPIKKPRPNGPVVNVSIYPMRGAAAEPYQIQDKTYVITYPTFGMSVAIANNVVTVTGQPLPGEYLTIVVNRKNAVSETGSTTAAILSALLADALPVYANASATATTITFPSAYELEARIGGVGLMGRATHRQRQSVMVSVWAPNEIVRTTIAMAIDVALKETITAEMPDGSMAKFCALHTDESDEQQLQTVYRRDLIMDCEYATLTTFPGYVVTTVDVQVRGGNQDLPENIPPIQHAIV